jgi:cytochrome P450
VGLASPPGPPAWTALRGLRGVRGRPLSFFHDAARRWGDVVQLWVGPKRVCLLSHPDGVKELLVNQGRNFIKSPALRRTKNVLGEGLLTSEGELHLRQRRLAQPAFHRDRIAGYARTMVEDAARAADGWRDGAEVDVHREMMRLTLGIAGKTLFGANVAPEAEEIAAALDVVMDLFPRTTLPFSTLLDRLPIPSTRRFFRARARLDETVHRMVRERRASGEDAGDLLSMLLSAREEGRGMSDEQVRDEAITLLLAGHETTANALSWSWYLLAGHPEAEAALHEELDAVLGGRLPGLDDLPRLPFTRAVLAESMRLFPPAWIVGREAVGPFEVGGYRVPAGALVFACQWVVHRDARFFPRPERFDPWRWTPEMEAALPRFAYFPFGGGTRKCIGESFAWTEGILVLATLAQRWRLSLLPSPPVQPVPLITLRPRYGIPVRLERR